MHRPLPVVLTVLAATPTVPAVAEAAVSPCKAPGRLLVASSTAAVTRLDDGYGDRTTWVCARRHSARLVTRSRGLTDIDLSGRYVAWTLSAQQESAQSGPSVGYVRRLDLRTGKRISLTVEQPAARVTSRVALSTDGQVYWTANLYPRDAQGNSIPPVGEVHRLSADGKDQLLDAGGAVDVASLAVSGRRAFWVNGDSPRTATSVPASSLECSTDRLRGRLERPRAGVPSLG